MESKIYTNLLQEGPQISEADYKKCDDKEHMLDLPKSEASDCAKEYEQKSKALSPATKASIVLNERGLPIPSDIDGAYRVAEMWLRGGALPKWIKNATQALAAAQYCRSYGLEPLTAIQHLCEINGKMTFWGEGPLAVVRKSGELESINEFFIDADYNKICFSNKNLKSPIYAAICQLKRKGAVEKEFHFTVEDARRVNRGIEAIWKAYPDIMMKRKCRALALKDEFGDYLVGAGIAEYDFEKAPDLDTEEQPKLADVLNQQRKELINEAQPVV